MLPVIDIRTVSIAGLVIILALAYQYVYVPYTIDRNAARTYVFATNLFLRSSKVTDVEYNRIGKIPYGSELITYSNHDGWAEVKINGQKGFVSSDYLLDYTDFHLLNGIWGTLIHSAESPLGYTVEETVEVKGKENCITSLRGWGNKEGRFYTPGIYTYEIWCDGIKLYQTSITVVQDQDKTDFQARHETKTD